MGYKSRGTIIQYTKQKNNEYVKISCTNDFTIRVKDQCWNAFVGDKTAILLSKDTNIEFDDSFRNIIIQALQDKSVIEIEIEKDGSSRGYNTNEHNNQYGEISCEVNHEKDTVYKITGISLF